MAALAGAGCSAPAAEREAPTALKIGYGMASKSRDQSISVLRRMLYAESLLSLGWDGRPVPALAEKWEWKDEGRTLRLQLRPNLKFHDGSPVTVEFAADLLKRRVVDVRENPTYVGGLDYIEEVTTQAPSIIEIRLSRPDTFLLSAIDDLLIIDEEGRNGTGPFRIAGEQPHLVGERNGDYHQGAPGIARIEIIPYDTQRSAFSAMMRGEVDMVQEVARDSVEFLEGASRIHTYSALRHFYIPLVFNVRHPILANVEVRRALVQAIDRTQMVEEAMGGRGRVAEDPIWPLHWAYSATARRHSFNPEAARAQLDSLGFPVKPAPADASQMNSRFRIRCLYWAEDPEFERIALLLQRQFANVGVDLILEPAAIAEMSERIKAGQFDMHLFRLLGGRSFDWTYRFWHSPSGNQAAALQNTGYSGADAILERLRGANSDDDTRAAVAELQQRFYEDVPAAFIAWIETTRAVDERFNVGEKDDPDIFLNLWRWKAADNLKAAK